MPATKPTTRHKKAVRRRSGTTVNKKMRDMTHAERVEALRGKFARVPFSSEDHAAAKRAEIEGQSMGTGKLRTLKKPSPRVAVAARRKAGLLTLDERIRAVRGKYAWIPFSSEDFIAEKHRETEKEEQKWRSS